MWVGRGRKIHLVLLGDSHSRGLGTAFCSVGYVLHDLGTRYFPSFSALVF